MRELFADEVDSISGGLEKCEMSTATKVQLGIVTAVSPLMGIGFVAMYYAARDC